MQTSVAEPNNSSDGDKTPSQEIAAKLRPYLRPDKLREADEIVGMILHKSHSGPLPAPEDLAHYDAISPGAAHRIITMAESNMAHRHSMENTLVKSEYGLRTRGQYLAIVALFAMLAVIAFTFWLGQPIAGSILGGAVIVAVVGMFLGRDKETEKPPEPAPKQIRGRSKRKS